MKTKIRLLMLALLVGISICTSNTHAQKIQMSLKNQNGNELINFSPQVTDYIVNIPNETIGICNLIVGAGRNEVIMSLAINGISVDLNGLINEENGTTNFLYSYRVASQQVLFEVTVSNRVYRITVIPPALRLSNLIFRAICDTIRSESLIYEDFSPDKRTYHVKLPSTWSFPLHVNLYTRSLDPNAEIQLFVNDSFVSDLAQEWSHSSDFQINGPTSIKLRLDDGICQVEYEIEVIVPPFLLQLSLKSNNRELLKKFNSDTYSYSVFVADDLNSPTNQMIPIRWETTFPKDMTVQLNGQPLDSCIVENTTQKCHGTQLINKDSLTALEFRVIHNEDTAIYNVQLKVDVKVPATKLSVQGKNGTIWDLDPSPEVLSEYDMSACYRNNEGIWEKLLYLKIDQPTDSVIFNVEAPSGYMITKPEGWRRITYGENEFDVQTSRGIHKMNYHIIVDRGLLFDLNVAYIENYLNLPQEVTITEQDRRYGTNTDTLIYVVPATATSIKITANNVPAYVIVSNTSNLGTFALNSPDMQFLVTGTNSRTGITRNTVIRVLKDIVSTNNFSVTVYKKGQPNAAVPICVFPQFSPEIDTYMCIVPESEFEERTLRITTQYQNAGQVDINGFRIGDVQHDERYAFIKALPDISFHSLTNHQSNVQNSLRTDNFFVDSEVSTHQIYVDSLGGYLSYKTEKQLDGYYFITVKNGNVCKTYNLIVVSVNHAKVINNQKIETTPDANRYMGLLNPLNGELRFTTTGVYNNVNYKYINYADPEREYADLSSALSSNSDKLCPLLYAAEGTAIFFGIEMFYYAGKYWSSRGAGNLGDTEQLVNHSNNSLNLPDIGDTGASMATVITGNSGNGYFVAGFGLVGGGLAGITGCLVWYCKTDDCYAEWQYRWRYSKKSNIKIKNSTDAEKYQNLGDVNTIHVYPWSSNCEATFNVYGIGNEFIIHSTSSNHATLHFKRPALCTLSSSNKNLSEKEKNNRLAYRKTHNNTDMKLQVIDGSNSNTVTVEGDLQVNMEIKGNNNNVHSKKMFMVDLYGQNNTVACDSEGNEIRCNLNNNTISVSGSRIGIFGDATQITLNNAGNNTIDLLGYSGTGTLTDILNQYKDKTITRTVYLQGTSQNNFIQGVGYNSNNKPAGEYDWTLNCNIDSAPDKNKISINNWKTVSIMNNGKPYKISRESGAYELILNCQKANMSINGN